MGKITNTGLVEVPMGITLDDIIYKIGGGIPGGKAFKAVQTGGPSGASGNEEWGDLPVHLRKVFQNGVSEDVPPRYRDWVDSYYKRLNRGNRR